MPSIITFMGKAQIRWADHVTLMPDERIPKQLLYGELCQGKRSVSGQRKRFEDSLKVSLIDFSIDTQTWENLAADRPTWRSFIHSGAYVAEDNRTDAAGKKTRDAPEPQSTSKPPQFTCVQLMGEGFTLGLVSSATYGHTQPTSWKAEDVMVIFDSEGRTTTTTTTSVVLSRSLGYQCWIQVDLRSTL